MINKKLVIAFLVVYSIYLLAAIITPLSQHSKSRPNFGRLNRDWIISF
jgi:hypothetical protein